MFLLEKSSSYVNVDPMPKGYEQVYTRRAKSTTNMSILPVSLR